MIQTVKPRAQNIQKELGLLRSFVIGIAGKDKEGNYRPEFVNHVFLALNEKPQHQFKGAKSFLAHLRKR